MSESQASLITRELSVLVELMILTVSSPYYMIHYGEYRYKPD